MFRRSEKGFTLVELMIVVVIIGILASIAIPKFTSIIGKAKTSEAKTILGQIVALEKTYYFTNSAYTDFAIGENSPTIGFEQPDATSRRFSYSFATDTATAQEDETTLGIDVNGDGDYDDGLTLTLDNVRDSLTPDLVW